jgi:colanic acid biosynthesis glycosyl transferase WcaI
MKILLINQVFYPDVVATAQQLTDFAISLARDGQDVSVLASRRGYIDSHRIYPKNENYQGVMIHRVWPYTFGRKTKIARVLDAFFVNFAFFVKLLFLGRFEKVVCLTTPPLVGWVAVIISKWRGSEFIYWAMDINPDEAIEAGWLKKESIVAKALGNALKMIIKKSDKIIALDRFMKERLISKGALADKVYINPPWSHNENMDAVSHQENPFRQAHGLNGKFVVMYSGNHSICHPLDTLLEAALEMKDNEEIVFLFVGGGERVEDVLVFKQKHDLKNIKYLPYVPKEDLRYSLSAADLHVVVMGDPFVGIVHPCKIYGILSAGKPFILIGKKESSVGEIIKLENVGKQISHGDVEGLIQEINSSRLKNSEDADKMREIIEKKYSQSILIQKMEKIVVDIHDMSGKNV